MSGNEIKDRMQGIIKVVGVGGGGCSPCTRPSICCFTSSAPPASGTNA